MTRERFRRKGRLLQVLLPWFAAIVVAIAAFFCSPRPASTTQQNAVREISLKDEDALIYLEAVARIKQDALFLEANTSRGRIIQDTLKSYLQAKDSVSDFLPAQEYATFNKSRDKRYVGIGLEITRNRNGDVLGFPYPGGPAERAGFSPGERITHIDSVPVAGKSTFSLASMARGPAGTVVRLMLQTGALPSREISIQRTEVSARNVYKQQQGRVATVRVISFTRDTPSELSDILREWDKSQSIIIDLRSNGGGDLNAAIDSSMLFLRPGQKVVTVETRGGVRTYTSGKSAINTSTPVYLWQDEATASAAEVFVAALTQNGRASSIGRKTFGKGTQQDIIEFTDGSAMVLTTGYLLTPDGTDYREKGLPPTYLLPEGASTDEFLAKQEKLKASQNY